MIRFLLSPSATPPRSCGILLGAVLILTGAFAVSCTSSDHGLSQGRAVAESSPRADTPALRKPAVAAKILVTADGMYQLTMADLQAAGLGWDGVDPQRFRLSYRGREQSLWVEGQGETLTLRFYGQASRSRYARENVYWLQLNTGAGDAGRTGVRPAVSSSPERKPMDRYTATIRVEENRLYEPRVNMGEHWLWASLPAPQAQTFDITLSAVAPGSAHLQLAVWSSTKAPVSPDHHLRVAVNGQPVADETWDGQGRRIIEADLAANLLRDGVNTVRVEAPGDTGSAADITFVDWIEIRYPRFLIAEGDRLAFGSSGDPQRLSGFTGPVTVFDVTDPRNAATVEATRIQHQGEGAITFRGERGHRYVAVGPDGFRRPVGIIPATTSPDLRAPDRGADYIAVGPSELLEVLQPLLHWRESQGLQVIAVPVETVYDQFNHGLPEPEAIRAFLRYAVESWHPAPRYLLLVGDATYDPRGYTASPEANRLPTFLIPTVFGGETASDTAFAQLDDDPWPDIAVGRIPARTPDQVRIVVEKALAYEQRSPEGPWQRRVLAIADGQDPAFRLEAQAFIARFPASYETLLLSPRAGATGVGPQVVRRLQEGQFLVAYFGHGSVMQWGKDRLFAAADSRALTNGERLPIMLNMTCLTGLFTHPWVESLAETLLWQPGGGAVAVLAPTSLTLPADQSFLSQALVEALLEQPTDPLGQIFLRAQRQVPADVAGTRDVMQTFLLFGDPALHLVGR